MDWELNKLQSIIIVWCTIGGEKMNETIYVLKNYGKIDIHLKNIIDEKGISRSRLATMVAMNYDLVNRYYNNKVTRVDLDVIARFCYVLNCELDEILTYKKEY